MNIKINIKIFALLLLFYLTKQIEIYAIFMIFTMIHEGAHLLCGILLGLKPQSLKIMPLGLCIEFKTKPEDYNHKIKKGNKLVMKKLIIAIAGPIANFIIAFFCYIGNVAIFNISCEAIIYTNLLIAIFNLLPIYPLDGGRVFKNLIRMYGGRAVALKYTNLISNIVVVVVTAIASIAILLYQNIAIFFMIIYLWVIVIRENKRYNLKSKIDRIIEKEKEVEDVKKYSEALYHHHQA